MLLYRSGNIYSVGYISYRWLHVYRKFNDKSMGTQFLLYNNLKEHFWVEIPSKNGITLFLNHVPKSFIREKGKIKFFFFFFFFK